ncbi:hypothetical protein RSAG8_04902, partial [Rhizoctonia solani AG-8 WAC10335]
MVAVNKTNNYKSLGSVTTSRSMTPSQSENVVVANSIPHATHKRFPNQDKSHSSDRPARERDGELMLAPKELKFCCLFSRDGSSGPSRLIGQRRVPIVDGSVGFSNIGRPLLANRDHPVHDDKTIGDRVHYTLRMDCRIGDFFSTEGSLPRQWKAWGVRDGIRYSLCITKFLCYRG